MSRITHLNTQEKSVNPSTKFLEWKSEAKCFSYYDKSLVNDSMTKEEKKEKGNVAVPLPFKFLFINHYHTVKGYHDATSTGIFSNEVFFIGSEPVSVRTHKGLEIASGIYKQIKPSIEAAGGKYHRSIYVMLEDGSLANISIKGAGVREWSEFFENNRRSLRNKWIEINEAKDEKKGRVSYSVPSFTLGSELSKDESSDADLASNKLQNYMDEYFRKDTHDEDDVPSDEAVTLF